MVVNLPLWHLKISQGDLPFFLSYVQSCIIQNRKSYCIPLNLTKYVISKRDNKLRNVINAANLVISDGISILWLSRRLGYKTVYRIAGIDFAESIISNSRKNEWKLFFFGASPQNIRIAVNNIEKKFGYPYVAGYHHGYYEPDEIKSIIDSINSSQADILLLGLGLPQKEYFIHDYYKKINVKFCLAIGGAFDVWADKKRRTPLRLQKIGFEWAYRGFYDKSRILSVFKYVLFFLKDFLFLSKMRCGS